MLICLSPKCPLQVSQMRGHSFACHQRLVFPKTAPKKVFHTSVYCHPSLGPQKHSGYLCTHKDLMYTAWVGSRARQERNRADRSTSLCTLTLTVISSWTPLDNNILPLCPRHSMPVFVSVYSNTTATIPCPRDGAASLAAMTCMIALAAAAQLSC